MRKLKFLVFPVMSIILTWMFISCRKQTSGWKGTITVENGVKVARNPEEPMFEEDVLFLEEELSIGEPEGREEYLFENLEWILVDGEGKIYIPERIGNRVQVKVFDEAGVFLMTIGRRGQGPGEFNQISHVQITPDQELMVFDKNISKLIYFSLEGDYLRSVSMKGKMAGEVMLTSRGGYIITDAETIPSNESEHFKFAMLVAEYSPDFEYIRTIAKDKFRSPVIFQAWMKRGFFPPDTVVCGHSETYEVHFYDAESGLKKIVKKDFTSLAVREEDKEKYKKSDVELPDSYPAFEDFSLDEEGRLFVKTYERGGDGKQPLYDVFDPDGRYIARTLLPALPKFWKNGKMYTIEEDEAGFQYVKRYRITWKYEKKGTTT